MRTSSSYFALFAVTLALSLGSASSQTASWTGLGGDSDWNNGLNWDLGTPAEGTNAIISAGITVDYNTPMAATSFAGVNNAGTLNISAAGFNMDAGGLAAYTSGALSLLRINSGGVVVATNSATIAFPTDSAVAVEGGTLIITNSTGNITFGVNGNFAGAGFTNNGGTVIFSQPLQSRGRYSRFAMNGGALNLSISATTTNGIYESSNDQERQFLINGGTANLGNFTISRTLHTVGSAGLVVSNGAVNTTSLQVGAAASRASATLFGGVLTNTGPFTICDRTNGATSGERRVFFYVRGGSVYSSDPSGVVVANQANNGSAAASVLGGFLDINSGLLVAEKITLVGPNALTNAHGTLTLSGSGSIYLGSGGLVGNVGYSNTTYTMTLNGGTLGAKDNFSIVGNGVLGGTFTVKAADLANTPHNITHTGVWSGSGGLVKTGGGTLTLATNCTYSGTTLIDAGTLALGVNGSISNTPSFNVSSGAKLDVSAVNGGFTLNGSRTLLGFGSVLGNVTAASGSTINPGSNLVTGTLTFSNSVTQAGGVFNHFDLSTNPTGPNNDLVVITGDLNASGVNTIEISGGGATGSVHPLIQYGGNFNGTLANFALTGASGSLSNNATTKTIYLIVAAAIRSPGSVTWVGGLGGNNWDVINTSNWLNGAVADYFVSGDNVLFDATGAANPLVNLVGNLSPSSITVGASGNYSFTGNGSLAGVSGLTKTNTGTLTITTTNGYTGATTIGGGVVEVTTLANGAFNSGIGAASASAANLVLDGGTLRYLGGSVSTDRAATLNAGGGAIDIATGGATLTVNGSLTGDGALTKAGPGNLLLAVANTHTNGTVINAGTLQLNNAAGAGTGGVTNNGASLRINGALVVDNPLNFSGATTVELSGVGAGNIALRGSWSGSGSVLVNFLTQNTNQTFTLGGLGGGNGHMWDFSGTVDLGTNTGFARFNNSSTSANFGSSNATFHLGTGDAMLSQRNGGTTTHLGALLGGPNTRLSGRRGDVVGIATYSIGGNNLSTTFQGIITNGINEAAIIKVGSGSLRLTGNSPYTGTTTLESGELQVDGTISASAVTVNGGTLLGNGSIGGAVTILPNGLLSPGASVGRLTMTSTLILSSGSTNLMEINKTAATNDSIVGLQTVSYGGTLVISNLAGTLAEGDAFKLFDSVPGTYFGAYDSVELPALGPDLYWDTSGLLVDGTIRVYKPRPAIQSFGIDGSNFFLTGTNGGNTSLYFIVLTSPDASAPLANWTPILTNTFDGSGNFTFTNTVNPNEPERYYLLKTP
jgi:autotransporter-associated beta strand protein